MLKLDPHQLQAVEDLSNGSILNGGVGSGKSRASLAYYYTKIGKGSMNFNGEGEYTLLKKKVNLYIITTARKRDTKEWEGELAPFGLTTNTKLKLNGVEIVIDSWNNIKKYADTKDSFFIFDEQRLVGSGAWVKAFLKIAKHNKWILLSATPGDTWLDYIPVFVANGFYKNRTAFTRRHVVYNPYVKFPMVMRYSETGVLSKYRKQIMVDMEYKRKTTHRKRVVKTKYNKEQYDILTKDRWNIFKDQPIENVSELGHAIRKVVNSDISRKKEFKKILSNHDKVIVFYNFNYELDILRTIAEELSIPSNEWNGHKHEPIPKTDKWMYLVQYTAGAEGWNCIETDTMIFYSQNYSYRVNHQAAGRIDRRNTPYSNLYYYTLLSNAPVDLAIQKCILEKKDFNEQIYFK